ncbi:MAG: potassium-transporting ATPase subunit C, partial [Rhodospirillaceae bacterium]
LIELDGKLIGSAVVGQRFSQPQYVHSRPSAAGRDGYDATQSGATNLSPTSKRLIADITTRAAAERAGFAGTGMVPDVPLDMITSSASGLDPDVSPAAAFFQVARVARVRRLDQEQVRMLVDLITEKRTFGVLGELRVNLLKLNLALDLMSRGSQPLP